SVRLGSLCRARGIGSSDLTEHRTRGQTCAAGVVEIEQATHHLATRIEPWNYFPIGVDHVGISVDTQAAEGECDSTRHVERLIWRVGQGIRPVRFINRQTLSTLSILDVRVERYIVADGLVVFV